VEWTPEQVRDLKLKRKGSKGRDEREWKEKRRKGRRRGEGTRFRSGASFSTSSSDAAGKE